MEIELRTERPLGWQTDKGKAKEIELERASTLQREERKADRKGENKREQAHYREKRERQVDKGKARESKYITERREKGR